MKTVDTSVKSLLLHLMLPLTSLFLLIVTILWASFLIVIVCNVMFFLVVSLYCVKCVFEWKLVRDIESASASKPVKA